MLKTCPPSQLENHLCVGPYRLILPGGYTRCLQLAASKGTSGAIQRGLVSFPSARAMGDRDLIDAATRCENGIVRKLDAVSHASRVVHHHRIANLLGRRRTRHRES